MFLFRFLLFTLISFGVSIATIPYEEIEFSIFNKKIFDERYQREIESNLFNSIKTTEQFFADQVVAYVC